MRNLLIVFFVFLLSSLDFKNPEKALPKAIYKHWVHSHEEDEAGARVYRPADFEFPPSRGREGFEIKQKGIFIRHAIGPSDIPERYTGTWKAKGKNTIAITFPDKKMKGYCLNIISVNDKILKIRK